MVPSLPLLSCESSESVKENPARKKNSRDNYSPASILSNISKTYERSPYDQI